MAMRFRKRRTMKYRLLLGAAIAMLALGAGPESTDWNAPPPDPSGSVALAERMEILAHQTLRSPKLPPKALDSSAALYRAAMKLDPTEPRYARSLADILLEQNDGPGAIAALTTYINQLPINGDQTAMVQLIDLILSSGTFQGADQKLNYLHSLLNKMTLAPEIRSEVAVRCANLLLERSQPDEALKMLNAALQLNPVNMKALGMKYVMSQATSLPLDRVEQLLGILQANPADAVVASRIAEQLAQLGLVDLAAKWYGFALEIRPSPSFVVDACAQFLLDDQPKEAVNLANAYLKAYPGSPDAWFMLLSASKYRMDQDPLDKDIQTNNADYLHKASIALINRLQEVRLSAGDTTATTRPMDFTEVPTLPDVSGDAGLLAKATSHPGVTNDYIAAASALAWFDIFYQHDAAGADPLLKVLAQLESPSDPTLRRLLAWQKYVGGDPNAAMPQLQALADNDPLAAMGVILIELSDMNKAPRADIDAQKLLEAHPSGVVGAIIWAQFASKAHLTIEPASGSGAVASLVTSVPERLLQMVQNGRAFYIARVEPVKSSFEYGEPLLVRVTLQNISGYTIAIGDNCAIHPDICFDAYFRGAQSDVEPAVAVGRLDTRLALAPGESMSSVVRVDADRLSPILYPSATADLILDLSMITNPLRLTPSGPNEPNETQFGPCGYSVRMEQMLERTATPLQTQDQINQLIARLSADDGGDQIRAIEIVEILINRLQTNKDPQVQKLIAALQQALVQTPTTKKPVVEAWKQFELAELMDPDEQLKATQSMALSSDWEARLLALILTQGLGARAIPVANSLSTDPEPIVRDYANAISPMLASMKTAPPTTLPDVPTDTQGANNP